jgi:cytochrome c
MRWPAVFLAVTLGFITGFALWSAGSAQHGEELFNRMCTGCHSLDSEKEGPRLRGVFGRASGTVEGFPYSDGLKKARVVWDEKTLDRWLTDTSSVAGDNDMAFRLESAGERADIIAYLKMLGAKR